MSDRLKTVCSFKTVDRLVCRRQGGVVRRLDTLGPVVNRNDQRRDKRWLAGLLRAEIAGGGKYSPGTRLPSYRQLAAEHGVAVNTAQAAVHLLVNEGLVNVELGSGTYVRDEVIELEGPGLRAELAEVRDQLRVAKQDLATAERALTKLVERLPSGGEL